MELQLRATGTAPTVTAPPGVQTSPLGLCLGPAALTK